jgi:hypothetical protein
MLRTQDKVILRQKGRASMIRGWLWQLARAGYQLDTEDHAMGQLVQPTSAEGNFSLEVFGRHGPGRLVMRPCTTRRPEVSTRNPGCGNSAPLGMNGTSWRPGPPVGRQCDVSRALNWRIRCNGCPVCSDSSGSPALRAIAGGDWCLQQGYRRGKREGKTPSC